MSNLLDGNRTSEVLSYIRCPLSLSKSVEELHEQYCSAQPYPHLVLDNLFPADLLTSMLDELPPESSEKWIHERRDRMVKSNLRSAVDLCDHAYDFASTIHSAAFLYLLTEITGVKALIPDPYLSGSGYHLVPAGGLFDVHADRNTDFYTGLERRVVMILYLNKDWKPEYGGQLELWSQDGTKCEKVVEPLFNRAILFEIGDKNFHAVRPVTAAEGIKRKSFITYFHTVGKNVIAHDSIFAPPIYKTTPPLLKRLAREALPPFLLRMVAKGLASR
jgi:hypothetical protein